MRTGGRIIAGEGLLSLERETEFILRLGFQSLEATNFIENGLDVGRFERGQLGLVPLLHVRVRLHEIVAGPARCPLTFAEFTLKEYMRGRSGAWVDEIPDGSDHSIDAVRYAMMEDVLRS